jgi:glycerophosphoryl diester phosphodiesterase
MTFAFLDTPVPIAFAHRGGIEGGENALAAFDAARQIGYRYIETDVRTTRDGVPVVFHDADLRRMTSDARQVKDLTAAEVGQIRLHDGDGVPTLAEALDAFPEIRFNIDLKDTAGVEPVAALLRRTGALPRVCVTSFSERRIDEARSLLGPEACTGLGIAGALRFFATSVVPGRVEHSDAAVLQLPLRWHGVPVVTPRLVARAHEAGLAVHVWTLNDETSISVALDSDVDGIMTDDLELLKKILLKRGLWNGTA